MYNVHWWWSFKNTLQLNVTYTLHRHTHSHLFTIPIPTSIAQTHNAHNPLFLSPLLMLYILTVITSVHRVTQINIFFCCCLVCMCQFEVTQTIINGISRWMDFFLPWVKATSALLEHACCVWVCDVRVCRKKHWIIRNSARSTSFEHMSNNNNNVIRVREREHQCKNRKMYYILYRYSCAFINANKWACNKRWTEGDSENQIEKNRERAKLMERHICKLRANY